MGKITVIGIGPGSYDNLTPEAREAIVTAEVVAGYKPYIKLIEDLVEGKEIIGNGMMQEVDRCRLAVESACQGKNTIVVSSGDSGVYGMAGLVLEIILKMEKEKRPEVKIIAGLSAVYASAAILGAPLMHDFAIISLSNRLTPLDLIMKRVELAAQGDFVIAFYNPKSKSRSTHIEEAQKILLKYKSPDTPVGIVNNATRANQTKVISTLKDFTKEDINMFSMVIVGNSQTFVQDGFMVTPRGYKV